MSLSVGFWRVHFQVLKGKAQAFSFFQFSKLFEALIVFEE